MGVSPFVRQCFVTAGVSINMFGHGSVVGFSAILLPQLRLPTSLIPVDESSGSWIASILGFALLLGNFLTPGLMGKFGRKKTHVLTTIPMITGWFLVIMANSVKSLIIARFLQGLSMGMSGLLSTVLVGEYTSPRNRGAFLSTISLALASGVLFSHALGSFLSWQRTALVNCMVAFSCLIIIILSPESPSWLAEQGRYEESRKVFRWLRGESNRADEVELEAMVEASILVRKSKDTQDYTSIRITLRRFFNNLKQTVKKREFYLPITLMMHINTMFQHAGANVLASYLNDVVRIVLGVEANAKFWMIQLGIQRICSSLLAIFLMRNLKRRTLLFSTGTLNVCSYLSIAAYVYAKSHDMLPTFLQAAWVPIFLINAHMFSLATGMVPLPHVIAGEVFPVEHRSLAGGISVMFLSGNLFISIKTAPGLFSTIGLYGAYCIYAGIVGYCLTVAWFLMPETKDRTLQEIEDGFRGRPLLPEEARLKPTIPAYEAVRRASVPIVG